MNYLWEFVIGTVVLTGVYKISAEVNSVEPRWTRAAFLYVVIAIIAAFFTSTTIYHWFFEQYYDVADLKTYNPVDVAQAKGKDMMDAGKLYFGEGTEIDFTRSWHFRHVDTYCVAPLVKRDGFGNIVTPSTGAVDFFVVGKNCCAVAASDFRCKGYDNPKARAGIRVLSDQEVSFYRLAVKQAETQHGYITGFPIFLTWTEDPVFDLEDTKSRGMAIYFIWLFAAFVWQTLLVCACTMRFSLLGRKPPGAN